MLLNCHENMNESWLVIVIFGYYKRYLSPISFPPIYHQLIYNLIIILICSKSVMTKVEILRKTYGWIIAGCQKEAIIRVMDEEKTPRDIRKEAKQFSDKVSRSSVSTILRSFVKRGIATCYNEEQRVGRLYGLTKLGKEVREMVLKKYQQDTDVTGKIN